MTTKHALLIGINKYPLYEAIHDKDFELSGCVNDALLIKSTLVEQFNFDRANIIELHDEAATRDAISANMGLLASRVKQDDIVVFHFSGHGRQFNSPKADEGSGVNSAIMPSDSGPAPHPNRDIADDYIQKWLVYLSGVTRNITLIFDSCHSGTMTRDSGDGTPRAGPPDGRVPEQMALEPPPAAMPSRQKLGASGWLALSDSYVVISGCTDVERSREFDIEYNGELTRNGALTHFLMQAIRSAQPGNTYRDVFESAQRQVTSRFPDQHPQIEGTLDKELFGTRNFKPMRYIPLTAMDGVNVTLSGGTAHGLLAGSRWLVYPPGTKRTEVAQPLGVVELRRVGPLTSEGFVTECSGQITAGARCIEKAPFSGLTPYRIDVSSLPDDDRARLTAAIQPSNLLAVAAADDAADAIASILEPGVQSAATGEVAAVGTVESRCWRLIDCASNLLMPVLAVCEYAVVDKLIHNLETAARYRNLLQRIPSGNGLDVEFTIYREAPSGEKEAANDGKFVFEDGDQLTFEIINREPSPVWVSMLDFDLTGGVSLIYPPERASEEIAAGGKVRIGPSALGLNDFEGEQGLETLRLMIATRHTDFSWLQQQPLRPAVTPDSPLREPAEQAAQTGTSRGDTGIEPEERWHLVDRRFILKRPPI